MANLTIFCDGTWNNRDQRHPPTTIARLDTLREAEDPDTTCYIPGVGANQDVPPDERLRDRFLGGAFARGLNNDIKDGYRWLIRTHSPGDRIFIFGFSRGAYTARSLAGLLRNSGLPDNEADVHEAFRWYRNRRSEAKPGSVESFKLRARLSPRIHADAAEKAWREGQGIAPGSPLDIA